MVLASALLLMALAAGLSWHFLQDPNKSGDQAAGAPPEIGNLHRRTSGREDEEAARAARRSTAVSLAAQRWYEELLERWPHFRADFKDIPDDQNGFLQFLNLSESSELINNGGLALPEEISSMINGRSSWDAAKLSLWFAENAEAFAVILEVAELQEQSVKGVDIERFAFISARLPMEIAALFHAKARLELESGSADGALRYFEASINLADHFDGVELPSLLAKTTATVVRKRAQDAFRSQILHSISQNPDALRQWREALIRTEDLNEAASRAMAAEWNIITRAYVLPTLLTGEAPWNGRIDEKPEKMNIPDQEAFLDAHANSLKSMMDQSASTNLNGFATGSTAPPERPPALSAAANEALDTFFVGASGWFHGMAHAESRTLMLDAGFAVLLGEEPPLEPITGKPFIWDPAARTLSLPAEAEALGVGIAPLALP